MNSVTLSCQFVSAVKENNSSKVIVEGMVHATQRRKGETEDQAVPYTLIFEAYGKTGESFLSLEAGAYLLVQGNLHIEKQPSLHYWVKVDSFTVLPEFKNIGEPFPNIFILNLIGNLGQNPELRYFESGAVHAKGSLAVRRDKSLTDWFNFTAWGRNAESLANYAKKGQTLGLTLKGAFSLADNGQTYLNCEVSNFSFVGKKEAA